MSSARTKSGVEQRASFDSDFRCNLNRESVIDPLDLEFEARGVRKVTTGITGLWQSVHSGVAFDPDVALPIIVSEFTKCWIVHQ
ncbi:hypothetical protein Bca52824_096095 [Brassica carinata]|uniref:Uncharacterized protein n=1 Tax=Brassica carinata TaxID=52824 RepID=A0A8X7P194_BRACI|nr:hypothetical protein Bca52824_096095 [Brassica carinata]